MIARHVAERNFEQSLRARFPELGPKAGSCAHCLGHAFESLQNAMTRPSLSKAGVRIFNEFAQDAERDYGLTREDVLGIFNASRLLPAVHLSNETVARIGSGELVLAQ